jgi:hypothetical protein
VLDRLAGTRARDRLFTVPRSWADLRMIDPSIEPSDRRPNWCYLTEPDGARTQAADLIATWVTAHGG